ncbi:unnamed protein product [Tenebrio molitor]|nr:unnamed protein product [Tenebrio molitor]
MELLWKTIHVNRSFSNYPNNDHYLSTKNCEKFFTTNHNNFNKSEAWFLGVSYVTVQFIGFVCIENFYLRLETFGVKMRTALTSLIYRKVLKLNLSQLGDTTIGKIITLITRDVNEFDIYTFYPTIMWCDSLRFLITCYVMYMEIGLLVLILLLIFCIMISIQVVLAKILASLKIKSLKKTDQRYQATKEMLDAITLIKCYLWGDNYRKKVSKIRK